MHRKLSGPKTLVLTLMVCAAVSMTGCVYVVVGSLGALGGYVVSPDTVEGIVTGRSYAEVWDAVIETVSILGVIQDRNDSGGIVIVNDHGFPCVRIGLASTPPRFPWPLPPYPEVALIMAILLIPRFFRWV